MPLASNILTTNDITVGLLADDGSYLTTDETFAAPGYGKSRREHGLGGAIYKIVNSPGP